MTPTSQNKNTKTTNIAYYMCIYIYIYTYIQTYTHTYIHTYICNKRRTGSNAGGLATLVATVLIIMVSWKHYTNCNVHKLSDQETCARTEQNPTS